MPADMGTKKPDHALCGWVQARLFAYLDGELNPSEQQKAQTHLDACAACRTELHQCRQAELALTTALESVPPAGDLRAGFYARLAASQPVRPNFGGWRLAAPALAFGLLALVVWRAGDWHSTPSDPSLVKRGNETVSVSRNVQPDSERSGNPVASTPNADTHMAIATTPAPSEADIITQTMRQVDALRTRQAMQSGAGGKKHPGHGSRTVSSLTSAGAKLARADYKRVPFRSDAGPSDRAAGSIDLAKPIAPDEGFALKVTVSASTHFGANLVGADYRRALPTPPVRSGTGPRDTASLKYKADSSLDLATPIAPDEGFALKVQDDERGFTTTAHLASYTADTGDGRVVSVQADGDTIMETSPTPNNN